MLYSVETVVLGLLTMLLPYMIVCLVNALLTVDRTLEEAALAFILLGISLGVTALMLKGLRPQRVQGQG